MKALVDAGRADLFWKIFYTLLLIEDRSIKQKDLAVACKRSKKWIETTLIASPTISHEALEKNLDAIDVALTDMKGGDDD